MVNRIDRARSASQRDSEDARTEPSRRGFLKTSAAVGAMSGVLAVTGKSASAQQRDDDDDGPPSGDSILLRGGTVLSMDSKVGEFIKADILIQGSKIVRIEPSIEASATVVDATGTVVLPGLIDTHRHCWQNYFRRAIPNADAVEYVNFTHFGFAKYTRPRDDYAANLISGLGAIESGVTCMMDYHNSRSPEHTDAAIQAHMESGVRAVYGYGPPGEGGAHWPQDVRRAKQKFFASDDQLVTMRLAVFQLVRSQYDLARELNLGIHHDGAFGPPGEPGAPPFPNVLAEWGRLGLLGPHVTMIHGTALPDSSFELLKQTGTRLALSTLADPHYRGLADSVPPIQKVLDHGVVAGLSTDVEVSIPADYFSQLRGTFYVQRLFANKRAADGEAHAPSPMTVQQVLHMATVGGAMCNGLGDSIGTLSPGKQADIIMVESEDIMNMPLNNAYGTVVHGADAGSVRNVMIAGRFKKWNGKLVDVDEGRVSRLVEESRDYLAQQSKLWSRKDIIGEGPLHKRTS